VKGTAARQARFPVVRFAAGVKLTPELVRQKLIVEWRVVGAGALPEERTTGGARLTLKMGQFQLAPRSPRPLHPLMPQIHPMDQAPDE
jgi:hypothetical protein